MVDVVTLFEQSLEVKAPVGWNWNVCSESPRRKCLRFFMDLKGVVGVTFFLLDPFDQLQLEIVECTLGTRIFVDGHRVRMGTCVVVDDGATVEFKNSMEIRITNP